MIISKETSSRHSEGTKALQNTNSALRIETLLPLFEATVILDFTFFSPVPCQLSLILSILDFY